MRIDFVLGSPALAARATRALIDREERKGKGASDHAPVIVEAGGRGGVLVLLPPSETKAPGGDGPPLDLSALTAPELTPVRTELVENLVKLADDVPAPAPRWAVREAGRRDRAQRRALDQPHPAGAHRYTGVLYDALDVASMTRAQRARAGRRLAVGPRCSVSSAPTTRSPPTGCPPARRCPACRRCGRCGSRPSPPCWPPSTSSWSICAAGPTPRSRRCPAR